MKKITFGIVLPLLLILMVGCQHDPVSPSEKETHFEKGVNPVTQIPRTGNAMSPELSFFNTMKKGTLSEDGAPTPLLAYLKQITENNSDIQHIGVASQIVNAGTENEYLEYTEFVLHFPPGIVKKADGSTRFYVYSYSNKDGRELRRFEAIVPDAPQAKKMMKRWLQSKKPQKQKTSSLVMSSGTCHQFQENDQCSAYYPEYDSWGLCEIDICSGSPGSDWPDEQDDDDWGSGGYDDGCTDPFGCDDGTGGSSGGDGSGGSGSSDCDPNAILQPAGCEENLENPPAGVDPQVYNQLNYKEKELCWSNPVDCVSVWQAKNTAENWARSIEPRTGEDFAGWNDPQDALRHARWNAEMAKNLGQVKAKKWGDAHEYTSQNETDPHALDPIEKSMDLWNNQVGRQIGENFPGSIENQLINAKSNGDLWLWRCQITSSRFGCGNTPLD